MAALRKKLIATWLKSKLPFSFLFCLFLVGGYKTVPFPLEIIVLIVGDYQLLVLEAVYNIEGN